MVVLCVGGLHSASNNNSLAMQAAWQSHCNRGMERPTQCRCPKEGRDVQQQSASQLSLEQVVQEALEGEVGDEDLLEVEGLVVLLVLMVQGDYEVGGPMVSLERVVQEAV